MAHALFLDQISDADVAELGPKAAVLARLRRDGISVPDGFVVPAAVFREFVARNDLAPLIQRVEAIPREDANPGVSDDLARLRDALARGELHPDVGDDLRRALARLVGEAGAVVVRSSASSEDRAAASGAGQYLTVLNVRDFRGFLAALRACWASLFDPAAVVYRARFAEPGNLPAIAVLVQAQIPCEVAGTLFTVDPVQGSDRVVVEATWGLGEAIAQGEVTPDRYVVDRETLAEAEPARVGHKRCQRVPDARHGTRLATVPNGRSRQRTLSPSQLSRLALLGLQIERALGGPQDIEWGFAAGRWWVFQARPITTPPAAPAEGSPETARWDWTSGFLDERLVEPVSPLGWSVLRRDLEEIAFREPLSMLGVDREALEPITRLWNRHPYVNVAVFAALYKLFPDWLLPEDARRFFPGGDVRRRRQAPSPRSLLDPAVWRGLLRAFLREPTLLSPVQNPAAWARFEPRYVAAIDAIGREVDELTDAQSINLAVVFRRVDGVDAWDRRLLRIHRWSLTLAEVWYSLLRRVGARLFGPARAAAFCASVVANLGDRSVRMNRELAGLRRLDSGTPELSAALRRFLADYGHRSFSLDLIRPGFAADPAQVLALLGNPGPAAGSPPIARATLDADTTDYAAGLAEVPVWARAALGLLAEQTRRSARLREDQRFAWQRGLAQLRRLYLLAGGVLARTGAIARAEDVFFLTVDEVRDPLAPTSDLRPRIAARGRRYAAEMERFAREGPASYPPFLRGNVPFEAAPEAAAIDLDNGRSALRGEPVSPGIGRGRARIILRPDDLEAVRPGDVLVARGADPAWTLIFDRLAALVTESGGQLSHAAVVAREYRLPAVLGVDRATQLIRPGDELVVDGTRGIVRKAS